MVTFVRQTPLSPTFNLLTCPISLGNHIDSRPIPLIAAPEVILVTTVAPNHSAFDAVFNGPEHIAPTPDNAAPPPYTPNRTSTPLSAPANETSLDNRPSQSTSGETPQEDPLPQANASSFWTTRPGSILTATAPTVFISLAIGFLLASRSR